MCLAVYLSDVSIKSLLCRECHHLLHWDSGWVFWMCLY